LLLLSTLRFDRFCSITFAGSLRLFDRSKWL
jgi:hypothetical protein